jgi:hypothetical protein
VQILPLPDEVAVHEYRHPTAFESARMAVVNVFDAGVRLPQMSQPKQSDLLAVITFGGFGSDQQCQPLIERQVVRGGLFELLRVCLCHSRQLQLMQSFQCLIVQHSVFSFIVIFIFIFVVIR